MESKEEVLVDLPCDFGPRRVEITVAAARQKSRKFEGAILLIQLSGVSSFESDAFSTKHCGRTREFILTNFFMKMPKDLLYDVQPSASHSFIDSGPKSADPWRASGAPKTILFLLNLGENGRCQTMLEDVERVSDGRVTWWGSWTTRLSVVKRLELVGRLQLLVEAVE